MTRSPKKFAAGTKVDIPTTQNQIRKMLEQHGAVDGFVVGEQGGIAVLRFHMKDRNLTFRMAVPRVPHNAPASANAKATQEARRMWRALLLCIKAKLESVKSGIETFEDAFLAQTVLPTGETFSEYAARAYPAAMEGRSLPPLTEGPRK